MFAQAGDGLGALASGSRCGEEDEVGGQWSFGEEGVDGALADAQTDSAGRKWSVIGNS